MKIVKINSQGINFQGQIKKEVIKEAIDALEEGKIVIYPTDTLYGLGVNIFDEDALNRIYSLKKRSSKKPISVCVSDIDWIPRIAEVSPETLEIISKLLPGPFTVILEKKAFISELLTAGSEKIGIRIPESPLCRQLSQNFPITTSSANISGKETKNSVAEILKQLKQNHGDKKINDIGLVIDGGPSKHDKPSTVIDFTFNPPKVVRKGVGMVDKVLLANYLSEDSECDN